MCGRFARLSSIQIIMRLLKAHGHPSLFDYSEAMQPRYNIAPSQTVLVVRVEPDQETRLIVPMRWGFIPFWADDPALGDRMINARAESVAEKPAFRNAFRRKRCLVPADGFYEWKKENGGKQPYYVRLRSGEPFAFAGLWERWEKRDEPIESFTILTTTPNELLEPIHNRMPVILAPKDHDAWLDPKHGDTARLRSMLRPYPAGEMEAYPVSKHVNNPQNDDETCVRRLD